jgi:PTH1 family peptidyl-tRNA hydrolase
MGIGHPGQKILADYVLEPFNQEELQHLVAFIDRAVTVLHNLVKEDVGQVMNKVNAVD